MTILNKTHHLYPSTIIIRDFNGSISVTDIIDSWEQIITNNLLTNSIKGVINNINNCELLMDFDSFNRLMIYLKEHEEFKNVKLAVIGTDSKKIVCPTMGEKTEIKLKIKPFSSVEAAVQWIIMG